MKIKLHIEDYSEGTIADLEIDKFDIDTHPDGAVDTIWVNFNLGSDQWEDFVTQLIKNEVVDAATLLAHLKDEGYPIEAKVKNSAFKIDLTIPPYGDDEEEEEDDEVA